MQVKLYAPEQGRRKFKGRIVGTDDESVTLEQDGAQVALGFNNIARARLVPDYDALMSGRGQAPAEQVPAGELVNDE